MKADTLPTAAKDRKEYPIATGVLDYFPDALAVIAHVSYVGNQQHNPGQPLHWSKEKSNDHADTMQRHYLQHGTLDEDGQRHSAKMAWRALALLQTEIEQESAVAPIPPEDLNKLCRHCDRRYGTHGALDDHCQGRATFFQEKP